MTPKKQIHHHPKKTIIPFLFIFLLGVFLVVFFNPRYWFEPLSQSITKKLEQSLNAEFFFYTVNGNINRALYADSLQIANKQHTFMFQADTVFISYKNIFSLLATHTFDTLKISHPVFITHSDSSRGMVKASPEKFVAFLNKLPAFKVKTILIEDGVVVREQDDEKNLQLQDLYGNFSLNTRGLKTNLKAQQVSFVVPGNNISVDSLNTSISVT
ncbi:MAG: hypothetical protein PHE86_02625, partial [Candidatus Marinimicrobia bacterium]|nr:hypothetical protein [Candidatus Neomarinimicrobiota bacterium]